MLINNTNIIDYGALLVSFCYVSPDMTIELLSKGMNHIKKELTVKPKPMELKLMFQLDEDIGIFTSKLLDNIIIDTEDGYIYDCFLLQTPAIVHIGLQIYEVTYTFSAIKKKSMIILNNPTSVNIQGDFDAPCIYEMTATKNMAFFTINGFKIKNLVANDTFILDGINKLIYRKATPDLSAFSDTNLTKFPKLTPGKHTFTLSDPTVNVMVKYYPIYL